MIDIHLLQEHFTIDWAKTGIGFGRLTIYKHKDDKIHIENEYMSKEFVKEVLCTLVDQSILDER